MLAAILTICGTMTLTSCDNDDNSIVPTPDEAVVLNCVKPDYLKAGDKVALISPLYFTPMDNVEKTANVLRKWELEPVVGPNVGKVIDGQYAGTVAERVSDIDVRQDGAALQFNIEGDQNEVNTADISAPSTPTATRMRLAGKRE